MAAPTGADAASEDTLSSPRSLARWPHCGDGVGSRRALLPAVSCICVDMGIKSCNFSKCRLGAPARAQCRKSLSAWLDQRDRA
jgi:hypothetical protein